VGNAPSWAQIATAHNQRLAGLGQVYADGVVELRWSDDRGRHFEQGDVELWLALPERAAIDITKFGERLMWLGCDARYAWVFEFDKKDGTALRLADRDGARDGDVDDERPNDDLPIDDLPIDPGIIIALAGLDRLPETGEAVARDQARDAWVLNVNGNRAPLRIYFDRRTTLPLRVEMIDGRGDVAYYSRIEPRRYEPLRRDGVAVESGSLVPTLVDVFSSDDRSAIKLSLREPGPDPAPQGYFDLDWLTGRFRPARMAGIVPVAANPGGP
jgi:hypothetical protein